MAKFEKFLAKSSTILWCLDKYHFWIILLLGLPAIWALFVPGFYGASDDLHIAWLYELDRVVRLGQFPPRFVPDLSFGFGYPLFNFVFPLPFYLGEIFHLFGLTFVDSIKAVFILSIPLSGYFMYKFLKVYAPEVLALAGAVLYIYTPYRATDVFVRGAIGESLAFIFLPLIALSIAKGNIGILALSTAGLLLSHNIMAYMFLPFFVVLALITGSKLKSFLAFALGLTISSYFWLPALFESKLMKYDTVFNFKDHFPTIRQLITPYFGYGASVPGPYDGMSFFLGVINIILVAVAVILVLRKRSKIVLWALGAFSVAFFMMNFRSGIVWEALPFLPYFQFPWRFLSLTTFAAPILVIALAKLKYSKFLGLIIIIGAILINFRYFKPHDFLGRNDDYYMNRYIPVPIASEEYLKTQEEYLRLPKDTQMRPDKVSPNQGLSASFNVNYEKETVFDYYKYYFPGWEVKIDGSRVEAYAGKPYGQIQFKVPAGKHLIEISFKETPSRKILDVISLLGLIGTTTIVIVQSTKYSRSKKL